MTTFAEREYVPGAPPAIVPDAPVIVYVPGVWDLLHAGHLNLLWRASRLGDVLIVGVVSDAGCRAYKGRFPAEHVELRVKHLERLGFIHAVVPQATTDPTPNLERFRPHALVHGDDWARLCEGQETLDRLGIEWISLPYTPDVSTSKLRGIA